MLAAKVKKFNMLKHKQTAHSSFPFWMMVNASVSACLISFSCYMYRFVGKIFKMKMSTLVTKYTDTFNVAFIISPQRCIMPLKKRLIYKYIHDVCLLKSKILLAWCSFLYNLLPTIISLFLIFSYNYMYHVLRY